MRPALFKSFIQSNNKNVDKVLSFDYNKKAMCTERAPYTLKADEIDVLS